MRGELDPSNAETLLGALGIERRTAPVRQLDRGATLGRYVVLDHLGAGGMGVVYSAYDPQLDRRVAIKLLRFEPEGDDGRGQVRLLREAQAMARVTHPNVVAVHDVGTDGGRVYLAMEFIEGQTLRAWLAEAPRSWREILDVFIRAGRGLAAAHAQKLVHRDFKPDNVMIAGDGRVVVMDFGIALGEVATKPEFADISGSTPSLVSMRVTQIGGLEGTPAYMSPEQLGDGTSDDRGDQFSFCVSLFESLYGTRPFVADRVPQLLFAITQGKIHEPAPATAIPGFVRRATIRGLRAEPEDRWPSMQELLAALDERPRRRRRARVLGGIAVVAIAVGNVAWWSRTTAVPCDGATVAFAGAWDSAARARVQAAVDVLDASWATPAVASVYQRLDSFAESWTAMHAEACRANEVDHVQSPKVMALRMACLDRARLEVVAVVDQLAMADLDTLANAHRLVAELPELSTCADATLLLGESNEAHDAQTQAEVDRLRTVIAQARARTLAGREAESAALLDPLRADVEATEDDALAADYAYALGRVRARTGHAPEAFVATESALRGALSAGRYERAAQLAGLLAYIGTHQLSRPAEALAYANVNLGLAQRLGHPQLQSAAHLAIGNAHIELGRSSEAEVEIRRAIELDRGTDAVVTAKLRHDLAGALARGDRWDDALREYAVARDVLIEELGPDHPDLATVHQSMGNASSRVGRLDEATIAFERARTIAVSAFGDSHASTWGTRVGLATVLSHRGHVTEAEVEMRAAAVAVEAGLGPRHPRTALVWGNVAIMNEQLGRYAESEAIARRVLEIYAGTLGLEHADTLGPGTALAASLAMQGRHAEADVEYVRLEKVRTATKGRESKAMGELLERWSMPLVALGRDEEAVAKLTEAVAIFEAVDDATPVDRARVRFLLAKALWPDVPSRARARELARAAIVDLEGATRRSAQAWLAAHP